MRRVLRTAVVAATTTVLALSTALSSDGRQAAGPGGSAPAAAAAALQTAPAPGSPNSGDSLFPRQGNGGYDVSRYRIGLRWFRSNTILATTKVTAKATQDLSRFNLDLRKLAVRWVHVDGATARFRQAGSELVVRPRQPIAEGASFTTVVRYAGVPKALSDADGSPDGWIRTTDGATVLAEPIGAMTWFPNNNTPRDKASYTMVVTAPKSLTVVSNGRLVDTSRHPHTTTWTWRERDPMASYLASVSIGHYQVIRGKTADGVPIRSYLDPTLGGERAAAKVRRIISYWQRLFGPYPFTSTGIIVDNVNTGYALEVQTRPVFDFAPDMVTLVHEFAHQWFGDSVTVRDWSDIWLHEGFATYAEWLWAARTEPGAPREIFQRLYDRHGQGSAFWGIPVAVPGSGAHLFGNAVYTRGAMVLEALRLKIGTHDFFVLLKRWTRRHHEANASTRDLKVLAERVSGRQLDRFFHVWLYTATKPRGY